MMSNNFVMATAGGHIRCTQCQAMAKSTRQQCRRPATRGKTVCKLHGGASTGPRTAEGRKRCSKARLVHGQETTKMRNERSLAVARLAVFEWAGHVMGFMKGPRTRGRKPNRMNEVEIEFQKIIRQHIKAHFSKPN